QVIKDQPAKEHRALLKEQGTRDRFPFILHDLRRRHPNQVVNAWDAHQGSVWLEFRRWDADNLPAFLVQKWDRPFHLNTVQVHLADTAAKFHEWHSELF